MLDLARGASLVYGPTAALARVRCPRQDSAPVAEVWSLLYTPPSSIPCYGMKEEQWTSSLNASRSFRVPALIAR
jgi:hypothetical protein